MEILGVTPYTGPAGVMLSPDEWLIVLADLTRLARAENADIRLKIHRYLESRELNGTD